MDLYQNDGTVYDILCFTFFYSALATYVNVRRTGQAFTMGQALRFLGLSVLALNSKEMAATLPVVLWAFELIYWRPPPGLPEVSWVGWDLGNTPFGSPRLRYHLQSQSSGAAPVPLRTIPSTPRPLRSTNFS